MSNEFNMKCKKVGYYRHSTKPIWVIREVTPVTMIKILNHDTCVVDNNGMLEITGITNLITCDRPEDEIFKYKLGEYEYEQKQTDDLFLKHDFYNETPGKYDDLLKTLEKFEVFFEGRKV